jgi:hypothetical protein
MLARVIFIPKLLALDMAALPGQPLRAFMQRERNFPQGQPLRRPLDWDRA